jgi:uncharacterized protein
VERHSNIGKWQLAGEKLPGVMTGRRRDQHISVESIWQEPSAFPGNTGRKERASRMHYLLFYEVGEDYVSRRAEFREAHLKKAWEASEHGALVLGGALANPVDGAVLLFRGDSPEVAEEFARADPYVTSGAVKRWHVREWTTVAGEDSARPIRPKAVAAGKKPLNEPAQPGGPDSSQEKDMILRMWRARSSIEKAGDYFRHATKKVFPALRAIQGHRGAYLLRRRVGDAIEIVVLTLWESMEAVRKFAGAEPEKAVVEPEARAILTSFDESVAHFEVVHSPEGAAQWQRQLC